MGYELLKRQCMEVGHIRQEKRASNNSYTIYVCFRGLYWCPKCLTWEECWRFKNWSDPEFECALRTCSQVYAVVDIACMLIQSSIPIDQQRRSNHCALMRAALNLSMAELLVACDWPERRNVWRAQSEATKRPRLGSCWWWQNLFYRPSEFILSRCCSAAPHFIANKLLTLLGLKVASKSTSKPPCPFPRSQEVTCLIWLRLMQL